MVKLRQYIADHKVGICIIVIVLVLVSLFAFSVRRYGWTWTGFVHYTTPKSNTEEFHPGKTLWDFMQLLIIPLVLVVGGFLLNRAQRQQELDIAKDREEERALQNYLEAMTELLLEKNLRTSEEGSEVRSIARARTLTILRSLSSERKGSILRFLYEAELIDGEETVIALGGADLREANLEMVNLEGVNLEEANLEEANLVAADLRGANLEEANLVAANLVVAYLGEANLERARLGLAKLEVANLSGAYLELASLTRANLRGAHLEGANLERARLKGAKLSEDSILPDGKKWTPDTDMARFTDPNHPDFWKPDA